MNNDIPESAQLKNQWLFDQLDVAYPAKESLLGRDIYQKNLSSKTYQQLPNDQPAAEVDEIYLVDFHKLTVLFSLHQASQYSNESDKAYILEFLSQIILSDDHKLYVGIVAGEVVASAIITEHEDSLLISDIVYQSKNGVTISFAKQLQSFWEQDHASKNINWVEV